jgi:ATP-dependent DNA helicase DinG
MTFTEQRMDRARKRSVHDAKPAGWVVVGNRALGDSRAVYSVVLNPDTKRYHCSCYDHANGESRARKVCSHVLGVILHRSTQRAEKTSSTLASKPRNDIAMGDDGGQNPSFAPPNEDEAEGMASGATAVIPSPRDTVFNNKLPDWVETIRPHQWDAVQEAVDGFRSGCEAVFIDAPTGSGKTLIGRMVSAILNTKSLYICSDKSLQDQFVRDFPSAVLKGRANYEPVGWEGEVNCGDCTLTSFEDDDCSWCEDARGCPYNVAKFSAMRHELAVLNTAYFMAEANTQGKSAFGQGRRGLVIVDECDVMERELMGYVEAAIGDRRAKELGIGKPEFVTKDDSVKEWVSGVVMPKIGVALEAAEDACADMDDIPPRTKVRLIRKRNGLSRLHDSFKYVETGLGDGGWVFDGYKTGGAVFKPVRVNAYGKDVLWGHAPQWLMMSATIISADELADSLGLDGVYRTVTVPMTFPVENRRIHVAPIANMSAKTAETEWPKMATAIGRILERHPHDRILVHTVSYKLAEFLDAQLLDRRVLTYRGAAERESVLAKFRNTDGAVLLAPSMDRGVDLRDDDCRVVVVAKLPFPYLGDKQVNARLYSEGGGRWYAVQTVRSLVQMTGRGVRSKDDWCASYVLDSQFTKNLWAKNKKLLPKWWTEALDWEFNVKSLR